MNWRTDVLALLVIAAGLTAGCNRPSSSGADPPPAGAAATALVPADLRNDTTVYPDAAMMRRLQVGKVHTDEYSRLQNRGFTRFRAGQ